MRNKMNSKAKVVIIAGHQHYHLARAVEDHGEQAVVEELAKDIVRRHDVPLWQAYTRAGIEMEAMLNIQRGDGRYKEIRRTLDEAAHKRATVIDADTVLTQPC